MTPTSTPPTGETPQHSIRLLKCIEYGHYLPWPSDLTPWPTCPSMFEGTVCEASMEPVSPVLVAAETRYWQHPDHPLFRVPQNVLEVAREVMRSAVPCKDVAPEQAEPLADAVVAALAEAGFLHVDNGGSDAPCRLEPHTSGLVYDADRDVMVCPLCGHEQHEEMGG